jgi:hypothetical protein
MSKELLQKATSELVVDPELITAVNEIFQGDIRLLDKLTITPEVEAKMGGRSKEAVPSDRTRGLQGSH